MSKQDRINRTYITNDESDGLDSWPNDKVEASEAVLQEMERQEREKDLRKRFYVRFHNVKG